MAQEEIVERRLAVPLYQRSLRLCPEPCGKAHIMIEFVEAFLFNAEEDQIPLDRLAAAGFDPRLWLEKVVALGRKMSEPETAEACGRAAVIGLRCLAEFDRGDARLNEAMQHLDEAATILETLGDANGARSVREDLQDISQGRILSSRPWDRADDAESI